MCIPRNGFLYLIAMLIVGWRVSDPLEQDLYVAIGYQVCMLGMELGSSDIAVTDFSGLAVSPILNIYIFHIKHNPF